MDTHWTYNDGGRSAAGFKGTTGDCVTRAIAIATGKPYKEVYAEINNFPERRIKHNKSQARTGVWVTTMRRYMESLGWVWVPTMFIGSGCKVHLKADELPNGRIVANCSKHVTAVIDGVIQDTYDPSRNGTRCVYGYFYKP